VRVNGIRWQEERTLYGQPPDARVFTTRIDDNGEMMVQFGDGGTSARLPTGRGNIRATYRQGLGVAGRVAANTLSRLMDRPTGLKAVTNPAAAEGGADSEMLEHARQNAPNTVRTFDRIVSLRDFEDAAREFTGIAKARSAWEWADESRRVRLTVACDGGAPLGPETQASLVRYLDLRRDPFRRMRVEDHTERPVLLALRVAAHSDYLVEGVRAAVRTTILEFFAFDHRDLGAGLHLSDLYQRLHDVEGVVAADIDVLIFKPLWWTILLLLIAILPSLRPFIWAWWLWTVWPGFLDNMRRRGLRFTGMLPDLVQPRLLVYSYELLSIQEPNTDLWIDVRTVSP
jgi:predicted phage baseplate assembly protein